MASPAQGESLDQVNWLLKWFFPIPTDNRTKDNLNLEPTDVTINRHFDSDIFAGLSGYRSHVQSFSVNNWL